MKPILALSGLTAFLCAVHWNSVLSGIGIGLGVGFFALWYWLIRQSMICGDRPTRFEGLPLTEDAPDDPNIVILRRNLIFVDSFGLPWLAPEGLRSDGASVQAILKWLPLTGFLTMRVIKGTPLQGPLKPAALIHDAKYAEAKDATFFAALVSRERADADRLIYEAAQCGRFLVDGKMIIRPALAKWRAFIVLAILRIAGFKAWRDDSVAAQSMREPGIQPSRPWPRPGAQPTRGE